MSPQAPECVQQRTLARGEFAERSLGILHVPEEESEHDSVEGAVGRGQALRPACDEGQSMKIGRRPEC